MTGGLSFSSISEMVLVVGASDGGSTLVGLEGNRPSPGTMIAGSDVTSLGWLDEDRLVSGGKRGGVAIWQTEIGELKKVARRIAGRELTESERVHFRILP